jgi:hypothetical protein
MYFNSRSSKHSTPKILTLTLTLNKLQVNERMATGVFRNKTECGVPVSLRLPEYIKVGCNIIRIPVAARITISNK